MHRIAGIERKLQGDNSGSRVLSSFGHLRGENGSVPYMARRVLMAVVSGGRIWDRPIGVRLDGWCESGLGQRRDDGGGCSTIRGRYEGMVSPGAYEDD